MIPKTAIVAVGGCLGGAAWISTNTCLSQHGRYYVDLISDDSHSDVPDKYLPGSLVRSGSNLDADFLGPLALLPRLKFCTLYNLPTLAMTNQILHGRLGALYSIYLYINAIVYTITPPLSTKSTIDMTSKHLETPKKNQIRGAAKFCDNNSLKYTKKSLAITFKATRS